MNRLALMWNILRVLLIIFCSYQVSTTMLDSLQAVRMLSISEGPESYRAIQVPLDTRHVVDVLNRRGQVSWSWLAALGLLALSPYAPISVVSRESTTVEQ